jgi:hypothetical protein
MSESARLNQKLYAMRQGMCESAILRARSIYGSECVSNPPYSQETPLESDYLEKKQACIPSIIGTKCGLSSTLTVARGQCVIDSSIDSQNPLARFSQYKRPLAPPVCPAVPQEVLNAFLPKASTACPIPNGPNYSSPI